MVIFFVSIAEVYFWLHDYGSVSCRLKYLPFILFTFLFYCLLIYFVVAASCSVITIVFYRQQVE